MATYFGSAAIGLGFYHIDVPTANEYNWLNFRNCGVLNVLKGEVDKSSVTELLNSVFCKNKQWSWQVREFSNKTLLVRFPPWKKVGDLIDLPAFHLGADVNVKITEWKGCVDLLDS